ncbi:endoplasmic reticulum Oxidoreductin 1-domain-containing protein [Staphylotrichum tortipilum]|uniref:Endoplasmic reticulum Oxidoreductin 1-domain-containing protein n=1 Tax=Staphylotrichum tortipilum TaxID=2831512 RepID=A0AAN6MUP1_9PEZI|nr:endoplasmic reticulum Oxidoreductin 1-domain-containing protein [Staphylotrichum longicolle]KAK3907058.1 endoplasmic reticulum Oxidoreductin 1-domain-containing protein [Staphylotrichum longicolle]
MKSAARLFYLSVFALWGPQVRCQDAEPSFQDACAISPKAIVSDACASYSTLERLNRNVKPALDDLTRTTDFFSHYRVNLFHKKCPFWNDENGMCGNIACAVETLDNEKDIPPVWRASELGKLEGPHARHPGKSVQKAQPKRPLQGGLGEGVGESCVVEYDDECDDRDYCVPEDESASSKGDYVSLLRNPERFTGYAGDGAKQVWDAIYRENCFQRSSFPHSAALGKDTSARGPAAMDFRAVIEAAGRQQVLQEQRQHNPLTPFVAKTGLEYEDECLEKRVFYRVISGMHASISTHLCWDFLNQTTGAWQPNVACYKGRLHGFPDRISNLYFNYALLTRAVAKLGPYLAQQQDYTFCLGDPDQDAATRAKVMAVTQKAASVPQIFDESLMFKNGEGPSLKEDFRNRFRNVSRLMDCVGCDKCRLWGKLQTAGYGTALKVLFEFDNNETPEVPVLKRTELVALFNTYARLSSSLNAIQKFRVMVEQPETATESGAGELKKPEKTGVIPEQAKKPRHVVVPSSPEAAPSEAASGEQKDDGEPPEYQNRTVKDEFDEELEKVMEAVRFVLRGWFRFPSIVWHIVTTELRRFWQFYIGLPVSPRAWEFGADRVDEL